MSEVTKPIATDETLQGVAKDTTLQSVAKSLGDKDAILLRMAEALDAKDTTQQRISEINAVSEEKKQEIEVVGEQVKATIPDDYSDLSEKANNASNIFANALKGTASGETVAIVDVSPVEHTVGVKVRSKNVAYRVIYGDVEVNPSATSTYGGVVMATMSLEAGKTYTISFNTENTGAALALVNWQRPYTIKGSRFFTADGTRKSVVIVMNSDYKSEASTMLQMDSSSTANSGLCSNFMIEEGTTATPYTEYVDVSTASVSKCGKNLISYPYDNTTLTRNGITFTDNGDGSITVNGTATSNSAFIFNSKWELADGATYIFSVKNNPIVPRGYFTYLDETNTAQFIKADEPFVWKKEYTPRSIYIEYKSGDVINNVKLYPQLEVGNTATEYEQYKEPVSYTPSADGTVEGVTSLYPVTTLLTDTAGVIVDCEYNRDLNKAFAELEEKLTNAVISLGGNV